MNDFAVMPLEHYDAACNALREKLGSSGLITSDRLAPLIQSITGTGKTISKMSCEVRTASGYLFGDANKDGVINEDDIIRIQEYVVMPDSTTIDKTTVDFNSDGVINMQDASALNTLISKLGENQVIGKITVTFTDNTTSVYYVPVDKVETEGSDGETGKEINKITIVTKTSSGNLLGDVNKDGSIDNADSIAIDRYTQGLVTDKDIDVEAADLNGDGIVDETDNELLVKKIISLKEGQILERVVIEYTDGSKYVDVKAIDVPAVSGNNLPYVDDNGILTWDNAAPSVDENGILTF